MSDEELERLRALVSPIFGRAFGGPYSVYLYGSRATGFARPDSDYDFAIVAPEPLAGSDLEAFRDALLETLSDAPDIDIVDMRSIPLTLAAQVLESGIVLVPGDDYGRAMLETRLMSMYASLNEERREILADIVERGSIYGR